MNSNIIRSTAVGGETWIEEGCFVTELFNTPVDPALSIARIRVAARTATRWHHLDVDERYLIAEGTGVVDVDERYLIAEGTGVVDVDGVPPTAVGPGDVVVVPAGCGQRIRNDTDDNLVFYCLCTPRFTPDAYHDEPERNSR